MSSHLPFPFHSTPHTRLHSYSFIDISLSLSRLLPLCLSSFFVPPPKVGFFDLDPNRVLSLVLDAYECDPANGAFLVLIDQFKKAYLPHVLGFKFQFYAAQATDAAATAAAAKATDAEATKKKKAEEEANGESTTTATISPAAAPSSLYQLTATLLAKHFVALDDILPHLSPTLEDCASLDARRQGAMASAAQAVGRVNLNETAQESKQRRANSSSGSGRNMDGIPTYDDAGASAANSSSSAESGSGSSEGPSGGGAEEGEEEGEGASNGRGVAGANQVCRCLCLCTCMYSVLLSACAVLK